jgi:hypothetical protein
MTERSFSPLAVAVGLAAVTADGVRKLPGLLFRLPPTVVRELSEAGHAARHRYDELALHGRDVLAGRPGTSSPVPPDAALVEIIEDTDPPEVGPPSGVAAAPPAPTPPLGLTEPVTLSDEVLDEVAQLTPGAELASAELPLADFDHQTVPQLRGRLRSLDLPQLVQLRDYEQAHGNRLPVLTLLDNRIAKLLAEPDDAR